MLLGYVVLENHIHFIASAETWQKRDSPAARWKGLEVDRQSTLGFGQVVAHTDERDPLVLKRVIDPLHLGQRTSRDNPGRCARESRCAGSR